MRHVFWLRRRGRLCNVTAHAATQEPSEEASRRPGALLGRGVRAIRALAFGACRGVSGRGHSDHRANAHPLADRARGDGPRPREAASREACEDCEPAPAARRSEDRQAVNGVASVEANQVEDARCCAEERLAQSDLSVQNWAFLLQVDTLPAAEALAGLA